MITRHMRTHLRLEESQALFSELQLPISKLSLNQSPTPESLNLSGESDSVSPAVTNNLIQPLSISTNRSSLLINPFIQSGISEKTMIESAFDKQINNDHHLSASKQNNKDNLKNTENESDNIDVISIEITKTNTIEESTIPHTFLSSQTDNPFLVGVTNSLSSLNNINSNMNMNTNMENLNALSALLFQQQTFSTILPSSQLPSNLLEQKQTIPLQFQNLEQQQQQQSLSALNAATSKLFSVASAMAKAVDANQMTQQQLMLSSLNGSLDGNLFITCINFKINFLKIIKLYFFYYYTILSLVVYN